MIYMPSKINIFILMTIDAYIMKGSKKSKHRHLFSLLGEEEVEYDFNVQHNYQ